MKGSVSIRPDKREAFGFIFLPNNFFKLQAHVDIDILFYFIFPAIDPQQSRGKLPAQGVSTCMMMRETLFWTVSLGFLMVNEILIIALIS